MRMRMYASLILLNLYMISVTMRPFPYGYLHDYIIDLVAKLNQTDKHTDIKWIVSFAIIFINVPSHHINVAWFDINVA